MITVRSTEYVAMCDACHDPAVVMVRGNMHCLYLCADCIDKLKELLNENRQDDTGDTSEDR